MKKIKWETDTSISEEWAMNKKTGKMEMKKQTIHKQGDIVLTKSKMTIRKA